jgi:2-dehydro-3-deoxyphosphooctonate aldolase (KDO 8-P synthase)
MITRATRGFEIAKGVRIGGGAPLVLIAGPCVIESEGMLFENAARLVGLASKRGVPLVFKTSYDKANRTALENYRGPGLERGLEIVAAVKRKFGFPILLDIHSEDQISPAAEVADIIQVPAFLSRQTDLIAAVAKSGKVVNIKKGQFLSPWDMEHVAGKVTKSGGERLILTERGTTFGYNNLVVDMRSLAIMSDLGWPVVFDSTHSVQMPGGSKGCSSGDRRFAPALARAAIAVGIDGLFAEVHSEPEKAMCDSGNMLSFEMLDELVAEMSVLEKALYSERAHGG